MEIKAKVFQYLALGDSYTLGEAVEKHQNFPNQLAEKLQIKLNRNVNTKIIAKTGWRTDELLQAIKKETLNNNYDLVTLLIGVNNQYQHLKIDQYQQEFVELLKKAILLAQKDLNKVLVLSIPDYAFTPFGQGKITISQEIDVYNAFAEQTASNYGVRYINITDITRQGLQEPTLVAADDLHISAVAYEEIVKRILETIEFL